MSGLGKRAYKRPDNHSIFVLTGVALLRIDVFVPTTAAAIEGLARTALSHLPG